MKTLSVILALFLAVSGLARADEAAGWRAYNAGDYGIARDLFEQTASADSLAAACRTGLVLGGFFEKGDTSVITLHRAMDDCKAAIRLDPDHLDGRVSYAIALGFEAKRLKKAKYAKASREQLEAILVGSDDYGILHAALGGWHTTVYEAGFFARLALGAKRDIARGHFDKAVTLAPDDIGVRYEFIKYLAYGKQHEQEEALRQIEALAELPVHDAFDQFLLERAREIGAMIEAGDKRKLKAALVAATAFSLIREQKDLPAYPLEDE